MIESIVVWAGQPSCCVSGCEVGVAGEVVEGGLVGAVGGPQPGRGGRVRVGDLGEPGAQEMVVGVGEQQRVLEPGVGDLVAAGVGDARDEPVGTEPA
jgi:hypothetical protein